MTFTYSGLHFVSCVNEMAFSSIPSELRQGLLAGASILIDRVRTTGGQRLGQRVAIYSTQIPLEHVTQGEGRVITNTCTFLRQLRQPVQVF